MTIVNYNFQSLNWTTLGPNDPRGAGNQVPEGWTLDITGPNQSLPIPTKHSDCGTKVVNAIASGPPEAVHKLAAQLPPDEQMNKSHALILSGDKVYKIFAGGGGNSFGACLSQTVTYPAGSKIKIGCWVLAETNDAINPACGKLEDDHAWVVLDFGGIQDKRDWKTLQSHHDLFTSGNTRAWNLLQCENIIPADGKLPLRLTLQQNWRGNVDFFVGLFTDTIITADPNSNGGGAPTNPPPTTDKAEATQLFNIAFAQLNLAQTQLDAARRNVQALAALVDRILK